MIDLVASEQDFGVGGCRIHYEVHGEGDLVVPIANLAESPARWPGPHLPRLLEAGYQVLVHQHQGPGSRTIIEIAEDVGALLDHLGTPPARLLGYSQGAMIAQELALARPDLVRGAALFGTIGRTSAFTDLYVRAAERVAGREAEWPEFAALLALLNSSPLQFSDDGFIVELTAAASEATGALDPVVRRSIHATRTYGDRLHQLGSVAVPCLVVGFEMDLAALVNLAREVANAIPRCAYVEIAGAGHNGFDTHTKEVITPVLDFLRSI